MRQLVISGIILLLTLAVGPADASDPVAEDPAAVVRDVLREVPLIDGHNDAPWEIRSQVAGHLSQLDFRDTSTLAEPMHTDLERLRAGGVGGQFWSVWVPMDLPEAEAVVTVLEQIDLVDRLVARYPDALEMAYSADDIRRIHAAGRIASLIGVEGGHCIGGSLAVLRQLYALGARYMTLTHWNDLSWVDAATDEPISDGLSPFGVEVVLEMNRLGMLVDLSHVSEAAMDDALDASRAPVIFSHSSARALNSHPRNVPDRILERMRDNGGIVMVNFGAFFLDEKVLERYADYQAEKARLEALHPGDPALVASRLEAWSDAHPAPVVPLGVVADHIDHIRRVAGIDHVGLGSDFDGIGSVPEGLDDVSRYPALLEELVRRGYTRDEVAKVAGLNLLRVMDEAEAVARRLQTSEAPRDVLIDEIDQPHEAVSR